ncbi:MAG: response regulator transcription factor [Hyphomicrobiales bacterium]|nr:response regulator transcription factor [Hyphomicrobiales bacterium]
MINELISPIVHVVDDDAAVRRFLRGLIRTVDLEVETFDSAQSFLDGYIEGTPGCVLLDIRMPGMSGLELQKIMAARDISLPIIFLTGHGDVQIAVGAMKSGAFDFIEKPFRNDILLDVVQKAVRTGLDADMSRAEKVAIDNLILGLTERERQVMDMVVDGDTNRVIAQKFDISERTVENHRASVMNKMEANSLADLVKMLIRGEPI